MNLVEAEIILNIYTSVSLLIIYCHLPSMQFDGRFLLQWQNTRIDFNELFDEIFTKIGEVDSASKSAEKSEKLILLLICESRVDLPCPENTVFKKFMFSKNA